MSRASKASVLCVDDEPQILEGLKLNLGRKFTVFTANSGAEGLQVIDQEPSISVVVSDMRMPEMNGAKFLAAVRERNPKIVRMLLTGHADLQESIEVVNQGQIFRYLTKPCSVQDLTSAVRNAAEQYNLITARQVLLEQTLLGSVTAMMDILSITNPVVFGNATRVRRMCQALSNHIGVADAWKLEIAALMSRMGWVILPSDLTQKLNRGGGISESELTLIDKANEMSQQLVERIPQLDDIASLLEGSQRPWHTVSSKMLDENESVVAVQAQILRAVNAYDALSADGLNVNESIDALRKDQGQYDPNAIDALNDLLRDSDEDQDEIVEIAVGDLKAGMRLHADVILSDGNLLAVRGYEITERFIERLQTIETSLKLTRVQVVNLSLDVA